MIRSGTTILLLLATLAPAAWPAEGARGFADATSYLSQGDAEHAAAALWSYAEENPTAPLANQALDVCLLLDTGRAGPAALVPYVTALSLLADGCVATADVAFREIAGDDGEPWAVRGRAYLVAAELNVQGDRLALLERAWADCPDETARLVAVALAGEYYRASRLKDARAVRDAFVRRFPGDEGIKYFGYLSGGEPREER